VDVSVVGWAATIAGLVVIFGLDILLMGRRPRVVGMREAALSVVGYVALAALFGVGVWLVAGDRYSNEYFAGYITELSLSVDNLFVFVVIMTSFAVPLAYQLKVLQLGIIGTLVLRGLFIAVGARRPGRPADLPLLGSCRCAGVHRRQADPARRA
jgi:tellurite resistance protein TerC